MGKRCINRLSIEDLPADVLIHCILPRFDFPTWLRAAAVSHEWRRFALLAGPPIDVPWLWDNKNPPLDVFRYSAIPAPPANPPGRYIGCHGSYIISAGRMSLTIGLGWDMIVHIRNPFSGQVPFPLPVLHQPSYDQINIGRISADPASNQRCIIALASNTAVYLWRYGSENWVTVNLPGFDEIHDLAFHKDKLYCVDREGRITGFTPDVFLTQGTLSVQNYERQLWWKGTRHYLVEYCGGLLLVDGFYINSTDLHFLVQQLDAQAGRFVEVGDLGNLMLFVGNISSIVGFNNCNYPSETQFFTKNCIYLADLVSTKYDEVRIMKYNRITLKFSQKFFGCPPRHFLNYLPPTWSWINKPLLKLG